MLDELRTEYWLHVLDRRWDVACNCQREAVLMTGPRDCPAWAAPAIPECGFTEADRLAVRRDVLSLVQLRIQAYLTGRKLTPYDQDYVAARARLVAMTEAPCS